MNSLPRQFSKAAMLLLVSVHANGADWVMPEASDLSGSTSLKSVEADFDGDGMLDKAFLMLDHSEDQLGLFVSLAARPQDPILLNALPGVEAVSRMGLGVLAPGEHVTVCGKGYYECAPDEPAIVSAQSSSIRFFVEESASSFFVFMPDTGTFQQFWDSD